MKYMRTATVNGITVGYEVDNDEYIIKSITSDEPLPETIHLDSFYEAIDKDLNEDLGEHLAGIKADKY